MVQYLFLCAKLILQSLGFGSHGHGSLDSYNSMGFPQISWDCEFDR